MNYTYYYKYIIHKHCTLLDIFLSFEDFHIYYNWFIVQISRYNYIQISHLGISKKNHGESL